VAWLVGELATTFGLPGWLALPLGAAILFDVVRLIGSPVPPFVLEPKQVGNPPQDG